MSRRGGLCKEAAFNGFNGRQFQTIEAEGKWSNDITHQGGGGLKATSNDSNLVSMARREGDEWRGPAVEAARAKGRRKGEGHGWAGLG
jgi:hypothetical protein